MGSYFIAIVISIFAAQGLFVVLEQTAPQSPSVQELVNTPAHELVKMAQDPQSEVQIRAIRELARRPMSVDSIVPVLAKLSISRDPRISVAAGRSLNEIGESAAEYLRPLFEEKTKASSLIACSAAQAIGPPCQVYVPEFKQLLETGDKLERRAALFALVGIGDSNVEMLDEVIASLSDKDFNVRLMACRVLEKYGPKASKAEPRLLELLEKGSPPVRGFSAICLASIGPKLTTKDLAGRIAEKLQHGRARPVLPVEHERYMTALTMLGDESKKHLDLIRNGLGHHSTLVKGNSAIAIYRITGQSDEAKKVVEKILKDETRAPEMLILIGKLNDEAEPFLPAVSRCLDSTSPETREMAVVTLMELGIKDPAIVKRVKEMANDPEPDVASAVAEAIESFKNSDGENE